MVFRPPWVLLIFTWVSPMYIWGVQVDKLLLAFLSLICLLLQGSQPKTQKVDENLFFLLQYTTVLWKDWNLKWNQGMCNEESHVRILRRNKFKNREPDFPQTPDSWKAKTYLLSSELPPRTPPKLQANELPAWILAGHSPLCTPCP